MIVDSDNIDIDFSQSFFLIVIFTKVLGGMLDFCQLLRILFPVLSDQLKKLLFFNSLLNRPLSLPLLLSFVLIVHIQQIPLNQLIKHLCKSWRICIDSPDNMLSEHHKCKLYINI